jgi:DNA-binding transcriptional LysR family regulator
MEQNNISADDYILFATIAEQESLVRAAEHLGMPKATVSRRLANLETALGQRLLMRTTRRLSLTEFGQEFLDHCRRVAEEVASAQDFVHSQEVKPQGRLRVSMAEDYARHNMSRALATFIETYPDIQLDLDLSARLVDLIGERFDLAVRMGPLDNDSTLVARKIDEQHMGLYASPIYLSLHPAPKHPDDLQQHASVRMLSSLGQPIPWKLMRGKEVWEAVAPGRLTLNSIGVIQQLLLDGAGIGALPNRFTEDDVRLKRLVRILPEWNFPTVSAWAVMPMRRFLPAKTRVFLAHIEQYMVKG